MRNQNGNGEVRIPHSSLAFAIKCLDDVFFLKKLYNFNTVNIRGTGNRRLAG